jgi:hypothetical protein
MKNPYEQLEIEIYEMVGANPDPSNDILIDSAQVLPHVSTSWNMGDHIFAVGNHSIYSVWTDRLGNVSDPSQVISFEVQ